MKLVFVIFSISSCILLSFKAFAQIEASLGTNDYIARWVNFGPIGGQPQGGVACAPLGAGQKGIDDGVIYTTGDLTGLRKSTINGGDWVTISDPTAQDMFHSYTNLALDIKTFEDSNPDNDVIYIAKIATRFDSEGYFDNLIRSVDGGKTFYNVNGININNDRLRYVPLSIAAQGSFGRGLYAASEYDVASLFLIERTKDAQPLDLPSNNITIIYDVKALNDSIGIMSTNLGVYAIDYSGATPVFELLKDSNLDTDGSSRFMYVNPAEPYVVWINKKNSSSSGLLIKAVIDENWDITDTLSAPKWDVMSKLSFSPGLFAVYGNEANYHIAMVTAVKENPYAQGAFRTGNVLAKKGFALQSKTYFSQYDSGNLNFSLSNMPHANNAPGHPIRNRHGARHATQICATPTTDASKGSFHLSRFGGYNRSIDHGASFEWQNRGIHGIDAHEIVIQNNQLSAAFADHGLFRVDASKTGPDPWQEWLYDNWSQLDHKAVTSSGKILGSGYDVIVAPANDSLVYYIKTLDGGSKEGRGYWMIRRADDVNGTSFDYEHSWVDILESNHTKFGDANYSITMVLDYQTYWETLSSSNGEEALYVGTKVVDLTGESTPKGVFKLNGVDGKWSIEYLNNGLDTDDALNVRNIHTNLYGDLYIRTYDGVFRWDRGLEEWINISEVGNRGDTNEDAIAFDALDAKKMIFAAEGILKVSHDAGVTFNSNDQINLPKVPELAGGAPSGKGSRGTRYRPTSIAMQGDDIYLGTKLQWPWVNTEGKMPSGGVLHSSNNGATWDWLNRESTQTASISKSLQVAEDGYLYASEKGSGISRLEIIIDNEDTDNARPYYFYTNNTYWEQSSAETPDNQFGPEVKLPRKSLSYDSTSNFGRAVWQFQVPSNGYYQVYTRWNKEDGKTMRTDAEYQIVSIDDSGGEITTTLSVNQQVKSGEWFLLKDTNPSNTGPSAEGVYRFTAGVTHRVILNSKMPNHDGHVVNADAVRIAPFNPQIIVDNEDHNFDFSGGTLVSHYEDSANVWTYPYGPQKGRAPNSIQCKSFGEQSYAEWTFQVPISGYYSVSAWWAGLMVASGISWQSDKVVYQVYHTAGPGGKFVSLVCTSVNQRDSSLHSQWNQLSCGEPLVSSFYFEEGVIYSVRIEEEDQLGEVGKFYNADAIKIEFSHF